MGKKKTESTEIALKEGTALSSEKKKRSWVPHPQKNFGEENVSPGDNSRYLRKALVAWDLPAIDISDPEQVENRLREYFAFCLENDKKPNFIGMSNWIGVDRDTLKSWKNGEFRGTTHTPIIKRAVSLLEELWVDYMQDGKINPANGIFLAKNFWGYKDVQDVVVRPDNPLGDEIDQKALEERITATVVIDDEE